MGTLAETSYCDSENFDPQDPRCAKVLMTGKLQKVSISLIQNLLHIFHKIY